MAKKIYALPEGAVLIEFHRMLPRRERAERDGERPARLSGHVYSFDELTIDDDLDRVCQAGRLPG